MSIMGSDGAVRLLRCNLAKLFVSCALALPILIGAAASTYDEPYRPQIHFSPQKHWTNDPNGLVFFHGEYHLFFQFNPFGNKWGHMSWGHAVSNDLLHWKELPVAIPEQNGEMVFTGSVVVDGKNSSGFCRPNRECLVAVYTGYKKTPQMTRQTQNLAYSIDDGRTWTRYRANPVIDLHMADFRDPSVSWDEKNGRWLMAVSLPLEHKIRFYTSPNLREWKQLTDFGPIGDIDGAWECPDLLHIPGEDGNSEIWALKIGLNPGAPQGGSGEQYFFGHFDGTRFNALTEPASHGWTNYGRDDYCAINFNGLAPGDKPIVIGWMNNWQYAETLPTFPWRGQMSIPRRISFARDSAGLALKQEPVIVPLRDDRTEISPDNTFNKVQTPPFELDLDFGRPSEETFGVRIYSDLEHWTEVGFDRSRAQFYIDRTRSGKAITADFAGRTVAPLVAGRNYNVKLIIDRSSIEAFAQDGTIAMTDLVFPDAPGNRIEFFSASGKSIAATGEIWKLHPVWR